MDQLTDEEHAEATVSTTHTDKEWPSVKIADDFPPPKGTDQHNTPKGSTSRSRSATPTPASPTLPSPVPAAK